MASERIQLNLRLDGRPELLSAIKAAAAAKNLSINAFMLSVMESAVGMESSTASAPISEDLLSALDKMLDTKLDAKLDPLLDTKLDAKLALKLDKTLEAKLADFRTEPVGELAA